MCGNFNGNPDDDFIGKDKQLHETALEFAMSWQRGRESICEVGFTQEQVNLHINYILNFTYLMILDIYN